MICRTDSESKEKGGQIPHLDIDGFNPGEFFEDYLSTLNPEVDHLLPRPQRPSKTFDIHSNKVKCHYERSKIGENQVQKMMPKLSQILGIPRITNAQVRPTSVRRMKRCGISDRDICDMTGHKRISTLENYDPCPENNRKIDRAEAIIAGCISKPAPTSTITSATVQSVPDPSPVITVSTSLSNLR